ncbi:hypothetical protein Rhal01_02231 [Rubritalea halochordaticola]|uniref:Uncharacterized protein n=1 Tax=Rubritalea halochordaticola TaxID=714537 RepID=A0ABP9V0A1_9BACT
MRTFLVILLSLTLPAIADERPNHMVQAELKAQLVALELEVNQLLANGLDKNHPRVRTLNKRASELKQSIVTLKPPVEETLLFLQGTTAISLTSKEPVELQELLKQGWRIRSVTPAGESKAYLWLQK